MHRCSLSLCSKLSMGKTSIVNVRHIEWNLCELHVLLHYGNSSKGQMSLLKSSALAGKSSDLMSSVLCNLVIVTLVFQLLVIFFVVLIIRLSFHFFLFFFRRYFWIFLTLLLFFKYTNSMLEIKIWIFTWWPILDVKVVIQ